MTDIFFRWLHVAMVIACFYLAKSATLPFQRRLYLGLGVCYSSILLHHLAASFIHSAAALNSAETIAVSGCFAGLGIVGLAMWRRKHERA
jgi:hypothetical protein